MRIARTAVPFAFSSSYSSKQGTAITPSHSPRPLNRSYAFFPAIKTGNSESKETNIQKVTKRV